MNIKTETLLIAGGLLAVAYIVTKVGGKVSDTAEKVVNAVNPLNHDNVFASTVNKVGGALVSDPNGPGKNADGSWSLGGWLHDVLNPDTARAVAEVSNPYGPFDAGTGGNNW